ncbi:MAG: hypothetical protein M1823_001830 [Watsoniomyces obsoletus]|nr:MAG: hypothetical protein M1823_001830 [Watsoniomyces obsoletus]
MSSTQLPQESAPDRAVPHTNSEMHELEATVPAVKTERVDSVVSILGPEFADLSSDPNVSIYSHTGLDWRTVAAAEKRVTSPIQIEITPGTASLVDHRPTRRGHGLEVGNPPRASAEPQRYQPYRKAERILGTRLPTVADEEHASTVARNRQLPGDKKVARGPEPPKVPHDPQTNAGNTSPRSMSLPLTSNPVEKDGGRLSQLSPSAKRVSHVLPPISTAGPSNFSRKNIARTPYPASRSPGPRPSPSGARSAGANVLYVRLSGRNQGPPRLASVVVPGRLRSESSGKETSSPTSTSAFDDEQLFVSLREKYAKLRHPLRRLFSLRTLRSLDLVHVPTDGMAPTYPRSIGSSQLRHPHLTASLMMEHYRRPKQVRGSFVWIDWVHDISNELSEYAAEGPARLAVEFREGWSALRILLVWISTFLLSLAAGALWTVFGVDSNGQRGLETAGARVNTGVLLSGVILLLGWSLLGAWAVLSWLVM